MRMRFDLSFKGAREEAGADVEAADLKNYLMPLYDADWHTANDVPQTTALLREKMIVAQGLTYCQPLNVSSCAVEFPALREYF